MSDEKDNITVYYDGACPRCVRDRARYERLAGKAGVAATNWVDITGRDAELCELGVDPQAALRELHVSDAAGSLHRELDAYILLMSRVPLLRPLAWLIGLPGVRPLVSWCYRGGVRRRLRATHRL
ncbi:thiol-disulfide oxidoreductase DCC family protein [Aromatoleum diolicum]|uniref:DUF393 domain-containing protein n=1 Tax=Aromatoleum diolicum TaxID=75796 RepID=A0ABX1QEG7_9RHOO|nr:DUF393 domain-containing protein [Aromatoleum diolicum]NMG75782.1 DUF393 domain-containing protein [Aromatoleum diolicum]